MTRPPDPNRRPRYVEVRGGSWDWRHGPGGTDRFERFGRAGGVPWVGIVLVVLGLLFLADEYVPFIRLTASLVFLAIGAGLLVLWGTRRTSAALYAGTFITALAIPSLLRDLGVVAGGGWTWLALGLGLLFIAAIRYLERGGWGWQLWVGGLLALVGAAGTTVDLGRLGWPVLLVVLGLLFLARGAIDPRRPRSW
ncbi:MAG TPA: hypothetical protein VFR93_03005 [Candidatus Limnocylindrales bacterium]|nr:hypothetical protein [Candidatus Limnocylindrales bacterium]